MKASAARTGLFLWSEVSHERPRIFPGKSILNPGDINGLRPLCFACETLFINKQLACFYETLASSGPAPEPLPVAVYLNLRISPDSNRPR
ncbi:hypothetical protein SAMN04488238_101647 [Roseicitreum antarcticum]|uniref:Uncharacterized protein n=1 Tax=Roseicitreum antarcticum TaxID=564137 RepID=A0A1H2SMD7_9RHOB|nr:hypothetical protein SAMN04488238_101647 [Roseicitreum antarcticum]